MMTIKTENWLGEFVSTIGTGDAILGGAIDGFAGFSNIGDDVDVYYTIMDGLDKETGIGTLTGGKLVRKDIHAILVDGAYVKNGSAINLSGNAQVYGTANAHFLDYVQAVANAEIVNTQAIAELKALQINGHALTASFNLTAADVGAHPDSWMPSTEALNVYQKDASDIRYLKTQDAEQVAGLVMRVGGAREQQLQQSINDVSTAFIGNAPPAGAPVGKRWFDTESGRTYIKYNDGDSTQWIEESPQGLSPDGLESRIDEALRRSYAEAGFNLVDGSFEVGGTLVNANDVLLQESTGKAYTGHAGPVAAGTNPTSGGFVDVSGMVFRKQIIDSNGSLNAKVTPVGEATQITVSEAVSPIVGQQRSRINYYSGQVVEAWVPNTIVTAGFRFAGSYHKGRSPSYSSGANGKKLVSLIDDLGVESSVKPNNWYAVFACANDGDSSVTYKLMPFLRVGTVSGAKCDLTFAGMGVNAHSVTPTTYSWANDSLAGVDCLVITEGVDNRFSGRVDKITSNTAGSVTLNSVGTVGAFDFILPAPPNFKHYVYLGAFYRDVSEVMNIADSGVSAMFYGNTLLDPAWPASGSVASPGVKLSFGGYISPLATGIIVFDNMSISTSATSGDCATQYSHDSSNHVIGQHYVTKSSAPTISSVSRMDLTFSIGQMCYMYTAGSLQASRVSGSLQIRGWIEP